jgi:outer membrane protein
MSRAAAVCMAVLSFACATSYLSRAPPSHDSAPRSASGDRGDFSLPPLASPPVPAEGGTVDVDRAYGLPDLIDIGESMNPDTRIEWENARQAAFAVGLARSEYLPTISALALGGYRRTWLQVPTTSPTVTVGPSDVLPGVSFPLPAVTGSRHLGVDSFDLLPFLAIRWQLLDFGRSAGIEAAEHASMAANVSFTAAHQRVVFEVTRAYLRLSAGRAQTAVARDALQQTRAIAKATEARRQRGLATTVEVAEARREVAQGEYSLVQAQASETAVYTALLATLGVDPLRRLNIATISSRELPEHLDDSVDSYLRAALRTRPDLQAAVAMRSSAQATVSKSQTSFLPRMSLSGTAGAGWLGAKAEGAPWTTATAPNLAVLMSFEWTLFDFGVRDAQAEIARSRSNQAEQMVEKLQRHATQEVVAAYDDANANLARYKAAASLERTAAVAQDAVTKSYANGLATITDTFSAQKSRSLASAAKEQAFSEALIAATALVFASGQLGSADAVPDFPR